MSQENMILNHLKLGKSITPAEAYTVYGCLRLGARIFDLKKKGYKIRTETAGCDKHYAKYSLEFEKQMEMPYDGQLAG